MIADNRRSAREIKRAQTVILVDAAAGGETILALTGYNRIYAFRVRKLYLKRGIKAIADKRQKKPKELLTKKQREALVELIKTKKPSDCDSRYDSDYWTTGILGDYIERTHEVKYKSKTSLYLVFRAAKFTYHKPGRVYERRNPEAVEAWKKEALPIIKKAWKDPNIVIFTEDEMHLSSQTTVQKIWLPQGEYPQIKVTKKRESKSIYGFLNIKTGVEHSFKTDWQNMYITAEILPKLRTLYPNKKILIVWDKAGWHKGIEAQKVIQADGNIDTLYFPSAAPEENPQEHVWKKGRSQVTHNVFIENIDKTTDDFVSYLNSTRFPYALLGLKAKVSE
ncbi:IS630 family transposase [Candidatus Peregrinibacteria bacterium]|nr:IS630 family transposase [Candidatus Peregrinibacteria bacterium]